MDFFWKSKILEDLHLTNELRYYHFSSQAELTIDGVDDKEEMGITQVHWSHFQIANAKISQKRKNLSANHLTTE